MPSTETRVPPLLADAAGCAPAWLVWRVLALGLDLLLAGVAAGLIFTVIVAPESFPNAAEITERQMQATDVELRAAVREHRLPQFEFQEAYLEYSAALLRTLFLGLLAYFAASEWAMRGTTLGKMVFRLRAAQMGTADPPRWFESFVRSLVKTTSLFMPIFLLVNVLPMALHRTRRAGHDYFARTIVTGDPLPEEEDEADAAADED